MIGPFETPWPSALDWYAAATVVLLAACLASAAIRQPARRLAVARAALLGLFGLLAFAMLPSWPRANVLPPRAGPTATALSIAHAGIDQMHPVERPTISRITKADRRPEPSTAEPSRRPSTAPMSPATLSRSQIIRAALLAGFVLMLAWLALGACRVTTLRRRARPAPEHAREALARIVGDFGPAPRLLISESLHQPLAMGLARPTIILPANLAEGAPESRLDAALAHEWAHIRNRDLWLVALLRLLLPILYLHPAYWWLRRRIRDDQEALADAAAAELNGRLPYAEALLAWSQHSPAYPRAAGGALALFERPSQLKRRIVMLLDLDAQVESACPRRWNLALNTAATALILGLASLTLSPANAGPPQQPATAESPKASIRVDSKLGRVVDPDGRPVAGARVYGEPDEDRKIGRSYALTLVATTGPDGTFRPPAGPAHKPGSDKPEKRMLAAMAEGFGPAFADSAGEAVLKFAVDDVPIVGRVLDSKGRPVAGATAELVGIRWSPKGNLDDWLRAIQAGGEALTAQDGLMNWWSGFDFTSLYPPAVADGKGLFTLRGIGRERIATLLIRGPGIATESIFVVTRPMVPLRTQDPANGPPAPADVYHGSTFDLITDPGIEAVGIVTDADTGKLIPGARVETAGFLGNPLRNLSTTADAQGRYRLAGIAPRDNFGQNQTLLSSLDGGLPYLQSARGLGKTDGVSTVFIDFQLKRGVRLTGQVFDRATGAGVSAGLSYVIPLSNPHLKTYPRYDIYRLWPQFTTDDDGRFNLVVMPGPGVVGARAWKDDWRMGVGFESLPEAKHDSGPRQRWIDGQPETLAALNANTLIAIDPKEGEAAISRDIPLERIKPAKAEDLAPLGQPAADPRPNATTEPDARLGPILDEWQRRSSAVTSLDVQFSGKHRPPNLVEDEPFTGRSILKKGASTVFEIVELARRGRGPMTNRVVWTDDELHQIRTEAKIHHVWPIVLKDRGRLPAELALPFFWNLSVEGVLSKYHVTLIKEEAEFWILSFTPRNDKGRLTFSRAVLKLDRATFLPQAYLLYDAQGGWREYAVTEIQPNQPIPEEDFQVPLDDEPEFRRLDTSGPQRWPLRWFKLDLLP
ncbi:M56 family metallopeptidase [Isosphaeraceae bacterium EP7]